MVHSDSPKHTLRKIKVVTRNSTILNSVVEVNIGESFNTSKDFQWISELPSLLTPALLTLVKAIPEMRQLHTIKLNHIILSRMYLYTILSSPCLIHLILDTVQLPKISTLPPPKLRKLTLTMMSSWETVQPLISQLATSLEYLELQRCTFLPLSQLQLPPFPCLQELRHLQFTQSTFPKESQLNEFLRLGPQVTHLHVTGHVHESVSACQRSLRYLTTNAWTLSERTFGTEPFPWLMHLSLSLSGYFDELSRLLTLSSFIRDHFPRTTSLHLNIPWVFRNDAILMARSQHNVHTLKLIIDVEHGIEYEERRETRSCVPLEITNDQLHPAILSVALQTFELEVHQFFGGPERRTATLCSRWVSNDVVPFLTDLGGTGLKSIGISISVEMEPVLWRQWVKVPNDGWQILG